MTSVEPAAEHLEEPSAAARAAGGCVIGAIGVGGAALVVHTAPETAYVVLGAMLTHGWQRGRAWHDRRRETTAEGEEPAGEPVEETAPNVAEALRTLAAEGGSGVLLTRLREHLGLPDSPAGTKEVKRLLDQAGIPHKGVRGPTANGPGVHRDDIPPAPPEGEEPQEGRCCCRSDANANANNAPTDTPGEGFRVEHIGAAGRVVHDPADAVRHHTLAKGVTR
ncbi:hypothetical protein [Streptomyces sp. DH12]|uniref:hypothetical protein n=1 Tax=Streptomyces sp. DH12 TaxID=2857010 RepID=UPI001E32576D|nr:hypothetical protein [Streptomyces sp. DH12]